MLNGLNHPFAFLFFAYHSRHSLVGSSSGSGVSCGGRNFSGTLRRFTRILVHVDERPRIESTSISSTESSFATLRYFFFQRSSPASAASLSGEFAMINRGILTRFFAADFARDGATRVPSPSILRKCGG